MGQAEAARRLDKLRRNWLNPEEASETKLKKRTLTNLYNAHPTWLAMRTTNWIEQSLRPMGGRTTSRKKKS